MLQCDTPPGRLPPGGVEGTLNNVLQLSPGIEMQHLDAWGRGRFQLRLASTSAGPATAVQVCSVQLDPPPFEGKGAWRIVLRDRSGATVATLELLPESPIGNGLPATEKPSLETLTRRQREILELVAQGCAVKTIASRLAISVKTVEFHKTRLMRRLGMHGTAELTRFAVATGLIPI